jgi:hypothetical protein
VYQIKTLAVLGQHLVINEKTTKIIRKATNQEDMQQATHKDDNTTLNHDPSPAPLRYAGSLPPPLLDVHGRAQAQALYAPVGDP